MPAIESIMPIANFSLKSLKTFEARRGHGASGQIIIDKKRVASFNDDGDGYPMDVAFENDEAKEIVAQFIEKNQLKQLIVANQEMPQDSVDEIDNTSAIIYLVNAEIDRLEAVKMNKRMVKQTGSAFVICQSSGVFVRTTFGKLKLSEMAAMPDGLRTLQASYSKRCKALANGEFFVNTPEQLIALGLEVDRSKHGTVATE